MVITFEDFVFCFIYLLFIYIILVLFAKKRYGNDPITYKHFMWGFTVRAIGAISIGLIYQFYYGFGDTFGFYHMGKFFTLLTQYEPGETSNILLLGDKQYFISKAYQYGFSSWYAFNPSTVVIARICALTNMVSFGYYLPSSLFFALFSFSGVWKLYRVFTSLFPSLRRELAIFILFLPSVFFWGSGILKDSITMGALGWLTWAGFNVFIIRKKFLISLILGIISFYIIYQIKEYIALAYLPALAAWIAFNYVNTIGNKAGKQLIVICFIFSILVGFALIGSSLDSEFSESSLNAVTQQAVATQREIHELSAGSAYSLGNYEPGLGGFLKLMLPALVVTLFRPFIWEISSPFSILSAIESTFFIWITLKTFKEAGLKFFFKTLFNSPVILFCLSFAILFAIPVGIASGNFGSLVRYKIPCMPFYLIALYLIYYRSSGKRLLTKY